MIDMCELPRDWREAEAQADQKREETPGHPAPWLLPLFVGLALILFFASPWIAAAIVGWLS